MTDNLRKLIEYGQSFWIDDLARAMVQRGDLQKRITEQGLRGITSNPAIFHKAITKSADYDEQIASLVAEGRGVQEIYEALVIKDVRDACDVLLPVYEQTSGLDGFVSLEVSPYLAHDTDGTIREAIRLNEAVGRPNCLIKIPGTPACVPAIEECLARGINVNVTLLFSIQSYEAVAEAYIRALQRRVAANQPVDRLASVASFFLSRIDSLADQLLAHRIQPGAAGDAAKPEGLFGRAAVASAKLAYESFGRIFSGERWQRLAELGARVQRPLWASTSTKDPLYPDLKYVEPLIGPHTVNTMPGPTIAAFADHGVLEHGTITQNLAGAKQDLADLRKAGVDLDFVTEQLSNEGIQKFIEPYDQLMKALAAKREKLLSGKIASQELIAGDAKAEFIAAIESLDAKQYARRFHARDASLWKSDARQAAAIRNRLGWLESMKDFRQEVGAIVGFANEIREAQFQHVVLLGMGGSSLCPEVARETFGSAPGWPKLLVLDNTGPDAVANIESKIDLRHTLFLVASKSGTTTETSSFYSYFYERVKGLEPELAGNHFVAITDPGTCLVEEGCQRGFRRIFENPADIGGRYSALSYFGLIPMALIGVDIRRLLEGAVLMHQSCDSPLPGSVNPGVSLGVFLGILARRGRNKVTLVLSPTVSSFGAWAEQLVAESTGKEGQGLIPVDGEELGKPGDYGNDRVFVWMHLRDEADRKVQKKLQALESAGHPVARIEMSDALGLGAEFVRWEIATATAGAVLGVNPFDEPNVSESKKNTTDLLQEWKQTGTFIEGNPMAADDLIKIYCPENAPWLAGAGTDSLQECLLSFLGTAKPSDYFALLPYFLSTPSRDNKLASIREALRSRSGIATTLGYGPRYLHSTGQLHKGGPDRGIFFILTAVAAKDMPIPGQEFGFAVLQRAQALGDFRSLSQKGRRVIRIHLGSNIDKGLRLLLEMITPKKS